MNISFIMPGRNNLKYAIWSYASIQKNKGAHNVQICFADDASTDGTWDWCVKTMSKDSSFKAIRNSTNQRMGHTLLYDKLIKEVCINDIAIIWHCDMYLCPGSLDEIERLMYETEPDTDPENIGSVAITPIGIYPLRTNPQYKTIVSLTRIEPPLHPDGPEKYLADWGIEPEHFNEDKFLAWFSFEYKPKYDPPYTTGIFAPWAFFVKDFLEIGGHDPLYRPQSKEDSDIFNRFKLNGCKFIQTWKGCTYHMTCRGSRFNPTLTTPGKNSSEWEEHNIKSHRNFIRKWGSPVQHDQFMDPIIPNKYYTKFILKNTTISILKELEPFCDSLKTDLDPNLLQRYFVEESKNTDFDLGLKLSGNIIPSVQVYIDCSILSDEDYKYLFYLSSIIDSSNLEIGFSGTFKLGSLQVQIVMLKPITSTLIHLENSEYKFRLK